MNKKALSLAICLAMAIPTASNALSLGEIESKSSLNQPFQGRINLLQTNPSEVRNLRIRVASQEVFNRVGIDRPAFLNSLRFRTEVQNGRPVVLVSSNQPINEPFLNFLMEVSWPNGQLLKEYTVLLDPPALLRPNTAVANNNAGVRPEPIAQGRINRAPQPTPQQIQAQRQRQAQQAQRQRQAQQQRQAQAQRQAQQQRQAQASSTFERQARQVLQGQTQPRRVAAAPARRANTSNTYTVRRGDTLSKIASRLNYNGVRTDQMMVALFEKNRRAFSQGNMNNLKAGVVMTRPTLGEARSKTARAARAQIVAQARAWKSGRATQVASNGSKPSASNSSARLEVLGKTSNNAGSSSSGANSAAVADLNKKLALLNESLTTKQQENTELKSRVSELESLLRKKNRLIALKSEQLAGLQTGLANNNSPQTAQNNTPAPVQNAGQNTAQTPVENNVNTAQVAPETGEIVREEPNTAVVDNTPPPISESIQPVDPAQQEQAADPFKSEEASSGIMDLVTSPVGIGAGLGSLALLGGFAFMRRRKNKAEDVEDFSDLIDSGLNDQTFDDETVENEFNSDSFYSDAESDITTDLDIDSDLDVAAKSDDLEADEHGEPEVAEVAESAEEDSVESDEHLDDLIQEADVYIVYGLHDQAESEIKRALNTYPDSAALHAKLLENYKAAGDAEAFESATKTYLELDGSDKQEHWDEIREWGNALLPDSNLYDDAELPSGSSKAGIAAVAGAGAAMVAGTAIASSDKAGDLLSGMGDKVTDMFGSDDDSGKIEDTILDEFDEVDLSKEMDELADFGGLDDLDAEGLTDSLDIDVPEMPEIPEVADLTDEFEIDLDDDFGSITDDIADTELPTSLDDLADTAEAKVADSLGDVEDTDFLFDDDSLEDLLNEDELASASENTVLEASSTDFMGDSEIALDDATNLNLEIGGEDFDKLMPEDNAYKSSPDGEVASALDSDDNLLADFDDNLSFLDLDDDSEVIGETQIETKIDLAKAYIDMGDIDGARSTLAEVMEAGSDEQKRQAEELLHQNG